MARRSIESRLDRITDRLLPPGSVERRLFDRPDLRAAVQSHQAKTGRIISRLEKIRGAGGAFEALANGEFSLPPMPADLADALGLPAPPVFTADMTAVECAAAWDAYREGPEQ